MLSRTHARSLRAWADRLLSVPALPQLVRALPAARLSALIASIGLEDAGELVGLCTPEQLARIWDDDLWAAGAPGEDARFDAERFATWLAVLMAESPALAADKLAQVDFDLLCHGLAQLVWVIDIDALATDMSRGAPDDDDEQLEKILGDGLYHELEQYRVVSRHDARWDAVLALLVELHERDYELLCRLLERLADLTAGAADEQGGLYAVLTSAESLAEDVAASREERRAQAGWVAPSSAKALLALVRTSPLAALLDDRVPDPISTGHFRTLARVPALCAHASRAGQWAERMVDALEAAHPAARETPRESPRLRASRSHGRLSEALARLAHSDPARHAERVDEAAYIANVLFAGLGTEARRLRPAEAAEAAFRLCELGADHLHTRRPALELGAASLVHLFRVGFHLLCEQPERPEVAADPALHALRALATAGVGARAARR